ncbi:MAG: nitrilase-related carbon-nitrogen hydrolase [Chloroflexota bacterium]|nr:nitrilase-related carbon-nitrogen hydrolase [Chloroflexota bacterium]
MKINLVAVQARPELSDYASADAFHAKMSGLMQRAAASVDCQQPTLVAFPEAIGLFLAFVPFYYDAVKGCRTITQVMLKVIPRNLGRLLGTAWKHKASGLVRAAFLDTALRAEKMYVDTFSSLAKEYGVYLLGGSMYTPPIENEPSKGGRHILGSRVYNTAYLFSPRGLILRRVPKVNLVRPLETSIGVSGGPKSELCPIDTALGRIGTLVCYDGFHHTLVEHYDALGAQIILNPSYNHDPWHAPWVFDRRLTQEEEWLRYGLPSIIQGRENIRYGVNPMMVGRIFDLEAEGRSSISVNTGRPGASLEDALLAIAARPDEEEIIFASVDMAPTGPSGDERRPAALV